MFNMYDRIGPLGKGPGSQLTLIMFESTATACTHAGGDDGDPDGSVFMTTLASDTIGGSAWAYKNTAIRNCAKHNWNW